MVRILLLLIPILGVIDASYLSWLSATRTSECFGGHCAAVIGSSYGKFFGIPVATLGLSVYLLLSYLAIRFYSGAHHLLKWILRISGVGSVVSVYFLYVQKFVLELWCPYCVLSAILMFSLCGLAWSHRKETSKEEKGDATDLITAFLVCFTMSIGLYQLLFVGDELWYHYDKSTGDLEVAEVGPTTYSLDEIDAAIGLPITKLKESLYEKRLDFLKQKLIEMAALDSEQSTRSFLQKRLQGVLKKPTEAELQVYFDKEVKSRYPAETFERTRSTIERKMLQERQKSALTQLIVELQKEYQFNVNLPKPSRLSIRSNPRGEITIGSPSAPVQIIEFSDFECPACKTMYHRISDAMAKHPGKIKWTYRHLPLQHIHKGSKDKAIAATCAYNMGEFDLYAGRLFTDQTPATSAELISYATELGLDRSAFLKCLKSGEGEALLAEDVKEAIRLGISSTPTVIINQKIWTSFPSDHEWKEIISQAEM
jgi:protein-disulfide isomerase/uncharacterized membrane protein